MSLVELIIKTQNELRDNRQYSAADKLDPILKEAEKEGWNLIEDGDPTGTGTYIVSGLYEKTKRRMVGEADFHQGKWLVADDFHVEAWRHQLKPY